MNNELYRKLQEDGRISDAYIVIKNLFNKNLENTEIFKEFIDFALTNANLDIEYTERKAYVNDANSALVIYSENTEITYETLELIKEYSNKINNCVMQIDMSEKSFLEGKLQKIENENNEHLNELQEIYKKILYTKKQADFEALLEETAKIELSLDKNNFTDTQNKTYETLTKSFSNVISSKMEELEHLRLLEVNKEAVRNFRDVFTEFKKNEGKYKNSEGNLKALVTNKLFAFDSHDLFNETLVYYNNIYSMIFNEISDELKYKLTEWSIGAAKIKKQVISYV